MAWERGAWEKSTSRGAPYSNTYHEGIVDNSRSSSPTTTVSGGVSFCPKCGSMMMSKNGIFRCRCGYTKDDVNSPSYISPQDRLRKQEIERRRYEQKQQDTKIQMNEILRVMRQGNTRSLAASIVGIPLSRIDYWYREGKIGTNQNTSHFYRELKNIEEDRERRKREEFNRKNRLRQQEYERQTRQVREKRKRQERLRKQQNEQSIKKQMKIVISQMKNGKTRAQAAPYADVSIISINDWFNKGRRREGRMYIDFYNQVNSIESKQKGNKAKTTVSSTNKSNSSTKDMISCPHCGRKYNKINLKCPYCKKYREDNKSVKPTSLSTYKPKSSTNAIVKCPKCGKTYNGRYYLKCPHCKKSKSKSNFITCSKCGRTYNKKINKECPQCKKSKAIVEIKYCQNCGKKINKNDLNYCSNCGASIKTGKKKISEKTTTKSPSTATDSSDWTFCCILIFIIFAIIGFLGVI